MLKVCSFLCLWHCDPYTLYATFPGWKLTNKRICAFIILVRLVKIRILLIPLLCMYTYEYSYVLVYFFLCINLQLAYQHPYHHSCHHMDQKYPRDQTIWSRHIQSNHYTISVSSMYYGIHFQNHNYNIKSRITILKTGRGRNEPVLTHDPKELDWYYLWSHHERIYGFPISEKIIFSS